MSNFKMGNSKFSRFVNGKGFYIALALCLVAIGTAAYVAVNGSKDLLGQLTSSGVTSSGVTSSGVTSSGKSSKSIVTSSIPNWDNPNKPTNKTVSGVTNNKEGQIGTAASTRNSKPETTKPKPNAGAKTEKPSAATAHETSSTAKLVFTDPVGIGTMLNGYSPDKPVYDTTMADWRVHDAVDIQAPEGTPVKACASGTVSAVKVDDMYGQEVVIDHGNGLKSIYANLSSKVNVKTGQKVEVGDTIGAVGETAQAETAEVAHLHFAMQKNGQSIDPLETIKDDDNSNDTE